MKRISSLYNILLAAILMCFALSLNAQQHKIDSLLHQGDVLRSQYRFDESIDTYYEALDIAEDTTSISADSLMRMTISDRILLSENGKSMSSFAGKPVVVAKHKFSVDDFFLYYPLPDRSWRQVPDQLDTMPATRFTKPFTHRRNLGRYSTPPRMRTALGTYTELNAKTLCGHIRLC